MDPAYKGVLITCISGCSVMKTVPRAVFCHAVWNPSEMELSQKKKASCEWHMSEFDLAQA